MKPPHSSLLLHSSDSTDFSLFSLTRCLSSSVIISIVLADSDLPSYIFVLDSFGQGCSHAEGVSGLGGAGLDVLDADCATCH